DYYCGADHGTGTNFVWVF
nr:immunoglobulin light chain junction region [Macaca mulatta]MOV97184.1 immunoglobulin light chain junction region [Macaca mulatta]MOV97276.1 immunoglobulin light chain junction region [Macaca mulatta]MOV98302.1 immunoglobulin light chain junction region [Macaca mulatta]MOV99043.1 immunoglobulin light chain junction region [Macaca mulatta]